MSHHGPVAAVPEFIASTLIAKNSPSIGRSILNLMFTISKSARLSSVVAVVEVVDVVVEVVVEVGVAHSNNTASAIV